MYIALGKTITTPVYNDPEMEWSGDYVPPDRIEDQFSWIKQQPIPEGNKPTSVRNYEIEKWIKIGVGVSVVGLLVALVVKK